jgi:hypothetical protein
MIDWLAWSADAFERAAAEEKPVLLAMGAAWCELTRRMDQETYADQECAALIARHFVPVRVDLDRHPDVFERYGMGASPSTAFLMPDGRIIAGTTVIAPREMRRILSNLGPTFRFQSRRLAEEIDGREERIDKVRRPDYPPAESVGPAIFQQTVRGIVATYDATHGGFGQAPKLPMAASLEVLLQAYAETGGADFARMLTGTLDAMAEGALFDPVDGGFFSASINERWSQPYHAKLLATQAGLLRVYARAAILLDRPVYLDRAERTWNYAATTLGLPETPLLAAGQASDPGYYAREGAWRASAAPPPVDRTIFADANAQMASALLAADAALDRPEWGARGLAIVEALDGDFHYVEGGVRRRDDLLRDPVRVALACLDAHEATGRPELLDRARRLLDRAHARFWDAEAGGLKDHAAERAPGLMARPHKEFADNAAAALADLRLAALAGEPAFRERAGRVLLSFPNFQYDYGHATAELAVAADWYVRPLVEVRLPAGADAAWRRAARAGAVPRRVVRTVGSRVEIAGRDGAPGSPEELKRWLTG